jgi:hypothetical protein
MLWRIPARANTAANFDWTNDSVDAISHLLEANIDFALS